MSDERQVITEVHDTVLAGASNYYPSPGGKGDWIALTGIQFPVYVSFDQGPNELYNVGDVVRRRFSSVTITNPDANNNCVVDFRIGRNVPVIKNVPTPLTHYTAPSDVTCGAGVATQIFAGATLCNLMIAFTQAMRFGGATVQGNLPGANNGVLIPAGQVITVNASRPLYVYNPNGTAATCSITKVIA